MKDTIKSERLDDILRRIGSALWLLQTLEKDRTAKKIGQPYLFVL
ncbi:hypothetical protein [Shewanella halifaxensis]|nr:hypothetical protein [Shewanella halifaxensis]